MSTATATSCKMGPPLFPLPPLRLNKHKISSRVTRAITSRSSLHLNPTPLPTPTQTPTPLQSSCLDFNHLVPTSYFRFSVRDPPVEEQITPPSFTPLGMPPSVNPTLQEMSSSEAIPAFALTTPP
ncbi:hypothetical protein AZE42_13289, partial [Rhizopogon vesiculosus]